jgi:transposase
MGLIRGALHIASYGTVSPKSKKQRTAAMQLAAMQGASEPEIKIAGSRNFDFVNQDKIRRLQQRMAKLKQKISGCLRTLTGARQFCAIRSYLPTAAKHGLSFFDALVMLTEGQPCVL